MRAFWLMAAVLPLAAQPKLLINAKVDTRSAAAGLEREFRTLLAAEPQPAWIGYTVPAAGGIQLGCGLVSSVIHLEPPDHAVILYRVEANAASRIRALSPDCEIDAGRVPVHWLSDVQPAESVEVLKGLITSGPSEAVRRQAMSSLGRSRDPRALAFFEDVLKR
jgi:hypothetical protein